MRSPVIACASSARGDAKPAVRLKELVSWPALPEPGDMAGHIPPLRNRGHERHPRRRFLGAGGRGVQPESESSSNTSSRHAGPPTTEGADAEEIGSGSH